ncbi:MAG: hypothetical protein GYB65_02325 [Chloroflexi bacterium]|nr:hypothetical protein [Chloroflexota bacterium]
MTQTYYLEKLPNEPIVIVTMTAEFDTQRDLSPGNPKAYNYFEANPDGITAPVFFINDFSAATLTLEDLIFGATVTSRSAKSVYHHPLVREVIMIPSSDLHKAAAEGLRSDVFGNVALQIIDTLEEALAYARQQIAQSR